MGVPVVTDAFTYDIYARRRALDNRILEAVKRTKLSIADNLAPYRDKVLHGEEGCQAIEQHGTWLESEAARLIKRHSALFWISLDRRFPPGVLYPADAKRSYAMSGVANATKTCLYHKYGADELESYLVDENGSFTFLVSDQDMIEVFGPLTELFFHLAFIPNEYRRAAKSGTVRVDEALGIVAQLDEKTEKFGRLYDHRRTSAHAGYASTGGLGGFGQNVLAWSDEVQQSSSSTLGALSTNGRVGYRIAEFGVVAAPGYRPVELLIDSLKLLKPFEPRFEKTTGLTISQATLCLLALKRYVFKTRTAASEYTIVARGMRFTDRPTLWKHFKNAYREVGKELGQNTDDAQQVIGRYLEILRGDPSKYDIFLRQGCRSYSDGQNITALDLSLTYNSFFELLVDIELEDEMKEIKGSQFETYVFDHLQENVVGISFPIKPGTSLRRKGESNKFAQLDIYAQVEDVLFLIECKAYAVTRDYLKGTPKAVNNRWLTVESWLHSSDSRALKIVAARSGANYHLSEEIKYVVPVICSAFSEFIWSDDPSYYLAQGIPRVCSMVELEQVMTLHLGDIRSASYTLLLDDPTAAAAV